MLAISYLIDLRTKYEIYSWGYVAILGVLVYRFPIQTIALKLQLNK